MLMLGSLHLNKVSLYKEAKLDLGYRGLTVIRGHNLNAVNARRRTNGSGKSLLMSTLPNLAFSSHPVLATLGKRNSGMKTSLLKHKDSFIRYDLSRPEGEAVVDYSIIKEAKGKGIKYVVLKNGKDLELRTVPIAEEWLSNFFPFTEEEFYTHTYLDANRPFMLKVGSPTARAAFFSNMFHLEGYDYVRDSANNMKKALRDDGIRLEEMMRRASDLKTELDSTDEPKLDNECSTLRTKARKLKKRVDQLYEEQSNLKLWLSNKDVVKLLRTKLGGGLTEAELRVERETIKQKLKKIDLDLETLIDYREYRRSREQWETKKKSLEKKIGQDKRSIKDLRASIKAVESDRQSLRDKIGSAKSRLQDAERKLKSLDRKDVNKRAERKVRKLFKSNGVQNLKGLQRVLDQSLRQAEAKVSASQRILKMASDLSDGDTCVVCASDIRHEHKDSIVENLKQHLRRYQKSAGRCESRLELAKAAAVSIETRRNLKDAEATVRELQVRLKMLDRRMAKLPSVDGERKVLELKQTLDQLEAPKWKGDKPKGNRKKLTKARHKLFKLGAAIYSFLPVASAIAEVERKYKGQDVEKLSSTIDRRYKVKQQRQIKVLAKIARIEPLLKTWKRNSLAYIDLQAEIGEKKDALKDIPVLELVADIYSGKGLKNRKMKEYANYMQENMNRYADSIFHEKFRFEFHIEPNRFDIWAHSGVGKKVETRDVKVLSGAESRGFSMLTCMSLLFMLPSRNRTNILVLDEMDANLDEEGRAIFIDSFLPELGKIIPHLIVITPQNDEYPGSRSFIATKKGNETKLIPVQDHH